MKIVIDELELRKPCEKVKLFEMKGIVESFPNLVKTMKINNGVGLSSCQVGIHKTFFIAQISSITKLFINPKIIKYSEEKYVEEEGCLSFPGVYKNIKRSNHITIQYFDYKTKKIIKEDYSNFSARVIQHEYDHLQGICCILDKAIEEEGTINEKI
ncbi:peptide deformylase [Clostridium sp. FP2]|uniref:peptide deformylase n=1 Tax=Clostridium sp. FP2 TaxID=2724481 RepID=UPI0013E95456|nr:peptide deformylase [Clostridium sp. FP2]MBZ9622922.1 peptide deformylase [Clostridium sp. FP2]